MGITKEQGLAAWNRRWPMWVEKARAKHGAAYTYPSPVRSDEGKIEIVCPEHGSFWQRPAKHLHGQGCPKCSGLGADKMTPLRERYPAWDWSGVSITNSKTPLNLTCSIHGAFTTTYNALMNRREGLSVCPSCNRVSGGGVRRVPASTWVKRTKAAHGDAITLVGSPEGSQTLTTFRCVEHGEFEARPADIAYGHGCPTCGGTARIENLRKTIMVTPDEFRARAADCRGDEYEYDMTTFTGMKAPMRMICSTHGEFWQRPANHITLLAGCPSCAMSISKGEDEIARWLTDLGVDVVRRNRSILDGREIDIFLPQYSLGIEYCGLYWHGEGRKNNGYHKEKLDAATAKGIALLQVFEDEWLNKPRIVKSIIAHKLGMGQSVGARKLRLVKVEWNKAKEFFDYTHMAGAGSPASFCYALVNDIGGIIQAMSVGQNRYQGGGLEIYRMSSFPGIRVVGGVSRLLSAVRKEHPGVRVTTYADLRWGSGAGYGKVGFVRDGVTRPGYYWAKGLTRYSRVVMQKHKLHTILKIFDPELSEAENCRINGYWRVFDCGHSKWVIE